MEKVFKFYSAIAITMCLAGCSSPVTHDYPEQEIVTFMLHSLIQGRDEALPNYAQLDGQPWLNPPPRATLIIYAPPTPGDDIEPWDTLKTDAPIRVWWYFDNKLIETADKEAAIQKYVDLYEVESYDWLRYEFGILSISANNKKAIVYSGLSTCPECAGGSLLTIEKNDSGKWEVTDSELLWLN